jgi:glycosyltransferase involved in cell wall biosynthesis
VIANSLAVREKLIQSNVGAEKITVIYNGLDTSRLATRLGRAETILALGLARDTDGRMFVTILANMRHEVKDYPLFLRAAQRVKEAIPGAMFLLAGEGELAESLRGLAADLGIADSTIFLGRCDKVAELLSISDVCVLSSKAEGFSNSILEYMAAGCPVVATDVGGAREVIREGLTGYLVQSGDNQTMADRIISLLREPEKAREMGQRGRQIVEQTFSTAAQLRAVEGLYEKLLNTRTTRIIAPSLPAENSAISREH